MSIVAEPVTRARSATTLKQAARLHLDLEHELEHNAQAPADWQREAEDALDVLEDTWGADELRDAATDAGYTPKLSPAARRGMNGPPHGGRRRAANGGRSRAGAGSDAGAKTGAGSAKRSSGGSTTRKPGRRSSSRRSGRASSSRAWQRTGLPGAADNATGLVLQIVGVTIGLVLLYSVVRGRGPAAVRHAGNIFVGGLRAVIAPTDPLGRGRSRNPRADGSYGYEADVAASRRAGPPAPANAYERGVLNGTHAGPPASLRPRPTSPRHAPGPNGQTRPT